MQVTLTNGQIQNIVSVLNDFVNLKLNFKLSYRIGKVLRVLEPHAEDFAKERDKIIMEFAKKDDKGELIRPLNAEGQPEEDKVTLTDTGKFQERMIELAIEKITVVLPTTFTVEDLENESAIKVEPVRLMALLAMLEPEPEVEPVVEAEDDVISVEAEEVN